MDKTDDETSAAENGAVSAKVLDESSPGIDHFNIEQTDPLRTKAMSK